MAASATCQHRHIVGDNYGETCVECGKHLTGFGEWGRGGNVCRHCPGFLDGIDEFCIYCEISREQFNPDE